MIMINAKQSVDIIITIIFNLTLSHKTALFMLLLFTNHFILIQVQNHSISIFFYNFFFRVSSPIAQKDYVFDDDKKKYQKFHFQVERLIA